MGYAAPFDIEGEVKGLSFPNATITTENVQEMIEQESALIDQFVSVRYQTPITNASTLLVLKKICIDLVAYRVEKILKVKTAPDSDMIQEATTAGARAAAMKMLKMYSTGQLALSGAEILTTKTSKVYMSPASCTTERIFKKDEKQW